MSDHTQDVPLRVIKLGGSLLELPDLAERFGRWRSSQAPACDVVIVGGGQLVDSLRVRQPQCGLDDESMHWLAIDVMSQNAAIVAGLFSGARLTGDLESVRRNRRGEELVVFDVAPFMRSDRGAGALPCGWDVTSDSIAARVAITARADELVLLKSAPPEPERTLAELSSCGYVDAQFAKASADIQSVRFVGLRSDVYNEFEICVPLVPIIA